VAEGSEHAPARREKVGRRAGEDGSCIRVRRAGQRTLEGTYGGTGGGGASGQEVGRVGL
jgi:hypothetical protein